MFSDSFMKFLINYNVEEKPQEKEDKEELMFESVKVKEAARVVIASIKEII